MGFHAGELYHSRDIQFKVVHDRLANAKWNEGDNVGAMHLVAHHEGSCFTDDECANFGLLFPSSTACPPGHAELCSTELMLLSFLVHALARSLWAEDNDVANELGMLCETVRRGLALVIRGHKQLLLCTRFGQGELVCPIGAIMKVLLLALVT